MAEFKVESLTFIIRVYEGKGIPDIRNSNSKAAGKIYPHE